MQSQIKDKLFINHNWLRRSSEGLACQVDASSLGAHPDVRIVVHGGAWDIPAELHDAHARGVGVAYVAALESFRAHRCGIASVLAALEVLEADPTFDAGRGSFLNELGEVELDAGLMSGKSLRAGAVAGVRNFLHPSRIAYDVMEKTTHAFLVGEGAESFALKMGHRPLPPHELVEPRERLAHERWVAQGRPDAKVYFSQPVGDLPFAGLQPDRRGTVGVVVAVREPTARLGWSLFAGTSTGGTPGKMKGRVGDVPVIGAGVYADDEGAAVSCTGWGEGLLRIAAGQRISAMVRAGTPLPLAVELTLIDLKERLDGHAGIIAADASGNLAVSYTTPFLAVAAPMNCVTHLQPAGGCVTLRSQDN
jgi:L-asparaginase / beta-aspartyl-peptidase